MFVSFGTLKFEESIGKLPEGRKKRRTRRIQECEALRRFCLLVNPTGQAFHPHFFSGLISDVNDFPLDFNHRSEFIGKLLEKSYIQALERHRVSGSQGPTPNRINFELNKGPKHGRCLLTWTNSGGELRIILTLYRGHDARPALKIIGKHEHAVGTRARFAELPLPIFDRKWYGIQPRQVIEYRSHPSESELSKLLKCQKVPLGDFLEFLKKYQE